MKKFRQIAALAGVILLAGLYLATLAAALLDNPDSFFFLRLAIGGTIGIPVLLWIIGIFVRAGKKTDETEDGTGSTNGTGRAGGAGGADGTNGTNGTGSADGT